MKIVGFIPAKGNSTRLPYKNKKKILGVPIFFLFFNNLSRVIPRGDIYIDSDDNEILELAILNGFNTISRPSYLANNDTDGNKLLEWEASNVEDADIYIQHLPPMIFCKKETIQKGINAIRSGFQSTVYVNEEKSYTIENTTLLPIFLNTGNDAQFSEAIFDHVAALALKLGDCGTRTLANPYSPVLPDTLLYNAEVELKIFVPSGSVRE